MNTKGDSRNHLSSLLVPLLHSVMMIKIKSLPHSPVCTHAGKKINGSVYYLNNPAVIIYDLGLNYLGTPSFWGKT
jgi:hypothetical protein